MILNARNNQFIFNLPKHFFYPEVIERWEPVIKKLKLPYESLEDFMNSNIQSVTFPAIQTPNVEQQQSQFRITYRGGKEMEAAITEKTIDITFKLSESCYPYWILRDQYEKFLEYSKKIPFWPSMDLTFLDNNGFEIVTYEMSRIVPNFLSELNLSQASILTDFRTFNLSLTYNRFKVKNLLSTGKFESKPNY